MKKAALITVGVVVVGLAGAAAILPSLIPVDRIRQEAVSQVKAATGRDLVIDGKVSASVFPSLGVQVANVALSNPAGFQGKDMVRLGALDVRLKLMPLLSGKVEVDSFVLVDPVITLEVDRQGRANWVFNNGKSQAAASTDGANKGTGVDALKDLSLGDVRISNGRLTYLDGKAGTKEEVDGINLSLTLKHLDSPLTAKGGAKWRGKAVDFQVGVAKPAAVLDGTASGLDLAVSSDAVKLGLKGEVQGSAVKGDLDLSVPSVRGLAQWVTGKPLDVPGNGLGPFSLQGKLAVDGAKVALSQVALSLDAIKGKGDLAVDTGGARPSIKGSLAVDALDVNPYLPPEQSGAAGTKSGGTGDWSDAAIDLSALKSADVDLALSAGSILIQKIKIGQSALKLGLAGGKLTADLSKLDLYQGNATGRLAVDGSQPGVGLDASFSLKNLAAEPFLTDAAAFDRLAGTANGQIQVSGRGKSQRALISSLGGKGALTFTDGAIKGINLAEMVRNVTSSFSNSGGSQKTDFAELGGTFTIASGIVSNTDLALKSPLLRVEGTGTVEMPPRTQHYRITPKAVASLEGQGGKSDLTGLSVPVIVEGSWDKPTFRPDLEAMLKGQAKGAVDNALKGVTGGGSGSSSGGSALPINPGSLFGR